MSGVFQDLCYARRQLRKGPGFIIVAVVTSAVGIGAIVAPLSVINVVVFRQLPYNNVDRMVDIRTGSESDSQQLISWHAYLNLRKLTTSFEALAGYEDYWGMGLSVGKETRYLSVTHDLNVTHASDSCFAVFGSRPLLGQTVLPGEDEPGKNDVAILAYDVWRQSLDVTHSELNVGYGSRTTQLKRVGL